MEIRSRAGRDVLGLRIGPSHSGRQRRSRATFFGLAGLLVALALAACSASTATPTLPPSPSPSPTGLIIVPGSVIPTATEMSSESPTPTSTSPQQTAVETGAPGQTAAATVNATCPSAAAVGAALDLLAEQAPTGPTISSTQVGTESMTTCNYSGTFRTMVSFATFGSPADMAAAEAGAAAMQGSTAVTGLGEQAYYVPDAGLDVFVYPLSLIQISCSNSVSADQLEALARAVLGG
jgi:hypothetical protein